MSTADDFLRSFDEHGRYKNGTGDAEVVFLTTGGSRFSGRLRFRGGLLVGAEMDGAGSWGYPDGSPLDGLSFSLQFQGNERRVVTVERGRVVRTSMPAGQGAKERFLANLRVARNLFAHPRVDADSPTTDTDSVAEALTRSALWLTPKAVEGFDEADFPELPADRRAELANAVRAFAAVAGRVPVNRPPTKEEYRDGATAFIAILNIIAHYLPNPEESRKVVKALRTVPFPPWVVNWDYELGSSSEGDPAVWVTVFAEGNVPREALGRFGTRTGQVIREALEAEGVHRWPFLRLRTTTDFKTA